MSSPSDDSPVEDEIQIDLKPIFVKHHEHIGLEDLCKKTKFSKREIRTLYRGFKTVSICSQIYKVSSKRITSKFQYIQP